MGKQLNGRASVSSHSIERKYCKLTETNYARKRSNALFGNILIASWHSNRIRAAHSDLDWKINKLTRFFAATKTLVYQSRGTWNRRTARRLKNKSIFQAKWSKCGLAPSKAIFAKAATHNATSWFISGNNSLSELRRDVTQFWSVIFFLNRAFPSLPIQFAQITWAVSIKIARTKRNIFAFAAYDLQHFTCANVIS